MQGFRSLLRQCPGPRAKSKLALAPVLHFDTDVSSDPCCDSKNQSLMSECAICRGRLDAANSADAIPIIAQMARLRGMTFCAAACQFGEAVAADLAAEPSRR